MNSFHGAFKEACASLKKHMDKKETDRLKEENKKKESQDRERIKSQKQDLETRAKTLASSGKSMPAVFSIDRSEFEEVAVCDQVDKFDVHKPCIFASGGVLKDLTEEFMVKPNVKQVLTGFGGKYKKMDGFKDEGKVSATLTTKQGKEEAELYFSKVGKMLSLKPMCLTKISAAWNTTSWLWGARPSNLWIVSQTPQWGGLLQDGLPR